MAKNNTKYSRMCTDIVNNAITTEFSVRGDEASQQYEEVKGVGVGVSRRDKRRDFRHL